MPSPSNQRRIDALREQLRYARAGGKVAVQDVETQATTCKRLSEEGVPSRRTKMTWSRLLHEVVVALTENKLLGEGDRVRIVPIIDSFTPDAPKAPAFTHKPGKFAHPPRRF